MFRHVRKTLQRSIPPTYDVYSVVIVFSYTIYTAGCELKDVTAAVKTAHQPFYNYTKHNLEIIKADMGSGDALTGVPDSGVRAGGGGWQNMIWIHPECFIC